MYFKCDFVFASSFAKSYLETIEIEKSWKIDHNIFVLISLHIQML